MDRLERTDLLEHLKPGQVFLSTHDAFTALGDRDARGTMAPAGLSAVS